jgi:hypothetical protein
MVRGIMMDVKDRHPAIMVKDAILARSGIYIYGRDEMLLMGFSLEDAKASYRIFRPPSVIVEAKDKFAFVVVTKEHPVFDVSPDSFRKDAEGVVGNDINVVTLEDGNIGLKGQIAFYTKDVADYFEQGNRETSAQYRMTLARSNGPAKDGYDFIMTGITSVNCLAITAQGRGGSGVRVLDSMAIFDKGVGGSRMKKGFLSFLGIGKAKDADFSFSGVLLDSMVKVKALDAADTAGIDREVTGVMSYVTALGDSEAREVLAGAVADCYKNIDAVLVQKTEVAAKLDELYRKCCDSDTEAVKRILESGKSSDSGDKDKDKKDDGKDKKDGDGKDSRPQDVDALIVAAVDKAFDKMRDSIDTKVDAAVKKALGLDEKAGEKKPAMDSAKLPGSAVSEDASYLIKGIWGMR